MKSLKAQNHLEIFNLIFFKLKCDYDHIRDRRCAIDIQNIGASLIGSTNCKLQETAFPPKTK